MDDPQRGAGAGKANEAGLQGGPTDERALPIRTFCHRYGEQRLTLPERVTLIATTITGESKATTDSALWDTGANRSTISTRMARRLGVDYVTEDGAEIDNFNGLEYVGTAWIWMEFDGLRTSLTPVSVGRFKEGGLHPEVLIGMDVISQGRLTVDSTSGETVVTFELP